MIKVGVTGGIGSGKSIICRIFEILGVPVYYADMHSRKLVDTDSSIRKKLTGLFGTDIYTGTTLNRPRFAALIFSNPRLLALANEVIHPYVHEDFKRWAGNHNNKSYVIEEAAILFESGGESIVDKSIAVLAPVDIRIRRVLKRPGMTEERIMDVVSNQWTDEKKAALSDYVIVNDDKTLVLPQILYIHHQLTAQGLRVKTVV